MVDFPPLTVTKKKALTHWATRGLDVLTLETALMESIETSAWPLAVLLGRGGGAHDAGSPSAGLPWLLPFTPNLYVAVVERLLDRLDAAQAEAYATETPRDRLWDSVRRSLARDIDKRSLLVVPNLDPPTAGGGPGDGGGDGAALLATSSLRVAFTCGHAYRGAEHEAALHHLRQLMLKLDTALPVTTSVLLGDFRQDRISMACPRCVYSAIRSEAANASTVAEWGL